jgi:LysM repeat protein
MLLPSLLPIRTRARDIVIVALAVGVAATTNADRAGAQRRSRLPDALRGSKESVQKMWDFADSYRLPFYLTPTNIDDAIKSGRLVPLTGDSTYQLTSSVGFSYATREARQFVLAFAPQYLAACGTPLTVTSAARPMSRQPRNSNPYSVHPTGIAVDLRRPPAGPCQTWVRNALAELEAKGFVEATEERRPAHLHVAVLTEPGQVATLPNLVNASLASRVLPSAVASRSSTAARKAAPSAARSSTARESTTASKPARDSDATADVIRARTYRVREGDTLWDVARRTGVTVSALARENNRNPRAVLRPGVTLRVPRRG